MSNAVPDNKLRLSADVIRKAEEIATTWGLKNARAAIEAVFRKYSDDYLYGRSCPEHPVPPEVPDEMPEGVFAFPQEHVEVLYARVD
jgi:hypothetical protein